MPDREVRESMAQARTWSQIVMPHVVSFLWPGGRLFDIEHDQHPICRTLDTRSGIDYIVEHDGAVYGVSTRCQQHRFLRYCLSHFGAPTFTIRDERIGNGYRVESELRKTIAAVKSGAITAAYQVHAYMSEDERSIAACAVARRVPLFEYALHSPHVGWRETQDVKRGQTQRFAYIRWNALSNDIMVAVWGHKRDRFAIAPELYSNEECDTWLFAHGWTRNDAGRWVSPEGRIF